MSFFERIGENMMCAAEVYPNNVGYVVSHLGENTDKLSFQMNEEDNLNDFINYSSILDNNIDDYVNVTIEYIKLNNPTFTVNELIKEIKSELNSLVKFLKDNGFKREFVYFSSIRDMFDYILNDQILLKKHISFLKDLIDSFQSIVLKMGDEDYDNEYQKFSRKFLDLESYFYTEIYESSENVNQEVLDKCLNLLAR